MEVVCKDWDLRFNYLALLGCLKPLDKKKTKYLTCSKAIVGMGLMENQIEGKQESLQKMPKNLKETPIRKNISPVEVLGEELAHFKLKSKKPQKAARQMAQLYKTGYFTIKDIAAFYNISYGTTSRTINKMIEELGDV